jgi:predicted RNA binding protein YcfA (HicA-like mRNA interferase family)
MRRDSTQVTVPMHPSIDAGTLAKILKKGGVSVEEFVDQL